MTVRKVVGSLLSGKLSQRFADGSYPTTWVLFIGAQTSMMSFNIHHDDRLIRRERARGIQQQDNEAANALNYKTLGCSSFRQKILLATSEIVSCQVVPRDTLRLKSLWNVREATFFRRKRRTGLES